MKIIRFATSLLALAVAGSTAAPDAFAAKSSAPAGFVSLFNGRDLSGWKVPEGDNGHWKVINGVIDYDARSEANKAISVAEMRPGFFNRFITQAILMKRFKRTAQFRFRGGLR